MPARKKVVRKDKPVRETWIVCDKNGVLKYPPKIGLQAEGFSEEKARRLAEPAHESHAWTCLPISQWKQLVGHDTQEATS
jgi:hypothetical protein